MIKYLSIILLFVFQIGFGQSGPNIIFIMADDMGNGEFGFTSNNTRGFSTPIIDSLRAGGMYFSSYYTHPTCTPTRAALMSGKYPLRYGLHKWHQQHYEDRGLPDTVITIAEYMKESEYMTAIIGKWHLGIGLVSMLPQAQGFDYVFSSLQGNGDYYTRQNKFVYDLTENGIKYQDTTTYYTELITDKAIDWMNLQAADTTCPFFLYLPYTSPHVTSLAEQQASQSYVDMAPIGWTSNRKLQWAMDKVFDEQIGRIWQNVRDLGIENNTIIIVTSDNGGSNQNCGCQGNDPLVATNTNGDNYPFKGYKPQSWNGAVRVPLVWYQPGVIEENSTYDSICHTIDILPTLIQGVLGKSLSQFVDGINLYPSMLGTEPEVADRYILYNMGNTGGWGIRKGNYDLSSNSDVYIYNQNNGIENKVLYNVVTDPSQTTDIIGSNSATAAAMEAIIDEWLPKIQPDNYTGTLTQSVMNPLPNYWGQGSFYFNPLYRYYLQNLAR